MNETFGTGMFPPRFHIVDYLILVAMTVLSIGIGVFYGCTGDKQRTTKEYFKGNSKMSLIPVVLSLLASFISSNGMLGVPAEVYMYGFEYCGTLIGSILGLPLAAYAFLPIFYELQITSVYEYLERRFNRTIRIVGAVMSTITSLSYASFVTYGPSLALSQVTGFDLWGSIIATTVIGTFYTSLGGIKAVMWADSAQMVVFTIALLAVVVKGCLDSGGMSSILSTAIEGQRLKPLSFSFDPRIRFTFWAFLINNTIGWTNGYGVSQIQVQRYLSCPSRRAARKGIFLNFPGMSIVILLYGFIGILLYNRYYECDPISSKQIEAPDQIFPLFVMESMANIIGLPGLFVAGVYSAALSTTSSVLNSLAAVALEDFVKSVPRWKNMKDETAAKVSKGLAIGYGVVCLVIIAMIKNLGSIVQASMSVNGSTIGTSFALFVMGMFIPKVNAQGALIGTVFGVSAAWWVAIGSQIYKPLSSKLPMSVEGCAENFRQIALNSTRRYAESEIPEVYKISYLWIRPIAFFVTVIVGVIASHFVGSNTNTDDRLYSPLTRYVIRRYRSKFKPVPMDERPPSYNVVTEKNHLMEEINCQQAIVHSKDDIKTAAV